MQVVFVYFSSFLFLLRSSVCYPSTQTHKETREIREGENLRERPSRRETKREERSWSSTQVCDSGGQNQYPPWQCDSGGAHADFQPIVEDLRVAGGPISVAVICETRETREPVTRWTRRLEVWFSGDFWWFQWRFSGGLKQRRSPVVWDVIFRWIFMCLTKIQFVSNFL